MMMMMMMMIKMMIMMKMMMMITKMKIMMRLMMRILRPQQMMEKAANKGYKLKKYSIHVSPKLIKQILYSVKKIERNPNGPSKLSC